MRTTALGCGHWLKREDDEGIPPGAACGECGELVQPIATWMLDADGNRILLDLDAKAVERMREMPR